MILKLNSLLESADLYKEALTHKSLSADKNFERLEFLGDALLGSKITELLYLEYPKKEEGDLSRWKSAIVSQETLAGICNELDLTKHLMCKESERAALVKNPRIKASILESFFGAYYLDKGSEAISDLIRDLFKDRIENAKRIFSRQDSKTIFQERAQKVFKITPTYQYVEQTGPSHAPMFTVNVKLQDEVYESGKGRSMKEAQMEAARSAIIRLENS